jgi:hypothetical protein
MSKKQLFTIIESVCYVPSQKSYRSVEALESKAKVLDGWLRTVIWPNWTMFDLHHHWVVWIFERFA